LKQGLQASLRLMIRLVRERRREAGRRRAIDGDQRRPRAAATCIRPESLQTTKRGGASRSIAWVSEVAPQRLSGRLAGGCLVDDLSPMAWSLAEPSSQTA
jgi:hypothetical protein